MGVFKPREAFDSYEKRALEASAVRTKRTDELADGSDGETDGNGGSYDIVDVMVVEKGEEGKKTPSCVVLLSCGCLGYHQTT